MEALGVPFSCQDAVLPPIVLIAACFIVNATGKPFLQSFGNNLI